MNWRRMRFDRGNDQNAANFEFCTSEPAMCARGREPRRYATNALWLIVSIVRRMAWASCGKTPWIPS